MKYTTLRTALMSSVGVLALSALVAAEQPSASQQRSMDDMMKECRSHCQATTTSIEQLTKRMEEAKQSNDPEQMRTVLDQAQTSLTEMQNHMRGCRNMMSMMEHMHGGMGGMMKKGASGHMGEMMQEKGAQAEAEPRS